MLFKTILWYSRSFFVFTCFNFTNYSFFCILVLYTQLVRKFKEVHAKKNTYRNEMNQFLVFSPISSYLYAKNFNLIYGKYLKKERNFLKLIYWISRVFFFLNKAGFFLIFCSAMSYAFFQFFVFDFSGVSYKIIREIW